MSGLRDELASRLVDPHAPASPTRWRQVDAAVLIALSERDGELVTVLTERQADLRKHAGEISFPGGRRDPGEQLWQTAVRELEEELGLPRERVDVVGALTPMGTIGTGFRIHPFVGLVPDGVEWVPQESEVARVLEFSLSELVAGHRRQRLVSKGVPIAMSTYTVDGHLVWGATARILHQLLRRLGPLV